MKILKETGNYSQSNKEKNTKLAIIFIILAFPAFAVIGIFAIIVFLIGVGFLRTSVSWEKGIVGEEKVTKSLSSLDDSHLLLNDIKLPGGYGNIDHVLLCPKGIFVIETKNYSGEVTCFGDKWYKGHRHRKHYPIKSISKQVKSNAISLKKFLEEKDRKNYWISPIIVFTNPNVILKLNEPTVTVLNLDTVCSFIINAQSHYPPSDSELEQISKMILST